MESSIQGVKSGHFSLILASKMEMSFHFWTFSFETYQNGFILK